MRRILFVLMIISISCARTGNTGILSSSPERIDGWIEDRRWERLVAALSYVESRDDDAAVNPVSGATGRWQMTRIYVDEVNRILSLSGDARRFRYDDRKDPARARRMFDIFQSFHNP